MLRLAELFTTRPIFTEPPTADPGPRPHDGQLDLFGLSHPGLVRAQNQDHFLVATVHPQVVLHGTSLAHASALPLRGQRLATVLLVADGVGGGADGEAASRVATEAVTSYVASTLRCYHAAGTTRDTEFLDALRAAALEAHAAVRGDERQPGRGTRATTLTLAMVVWPCLYVVQVGDSRCYYYAGGALRQITRDQTVAQELLESGALSPEDASRSPLAQVLSSAVGGEEAMPVVTRVDTAPGGVVLLCSDGLTKHVSDTEIADRLRTLTSSEQACRDLLELALARGGSDNVTIVVGRVRRGRV
jgi:serine/threonine protein phosphatase PrpC